MNTCPLIVDDRDPLDGLDQPCADILVKSDVGQSLLLHRACFSPRQVSDSWYRIDLFHSTCTIGGRVCQFIIDSGSCENVVSSVVIDKLSIPSEPHPKTYKLAWLQQGSEIDVHRRDLLSVLIGLHYVDDILCEVIPMDTCQLLLGRPWQYDHHTTHNGRTNTYTFHLKEVNIVLLPSRASEPPPKPPPLQCPENVYACLEPGPPPFYVALNKCSFMTSSIIFLCYVVSSAGLQVDHSKISVIHDWPSPQSLAEGQFLWTLWAAMTFADIKDRLTSASILVLMDFSQPFELHCDASKLVIGCDPCAHYNTYDIEFYAIVQAIRHWHHYLFHREFILYTDHDALKHLGSQKKVSSRHASWIAYLQQFSFVIKHKFGVLNRVTDALSQRRSLLSDMHIFVIGFDVLPDAYVDDPFFSKIVPSVTNGLSSEYTFHDGFPFRGFQLCMPDCSLHLKLLLVGDHIKAWDTKLSLAEFAHNHAINRTTGFSSFHVVYGFSPNFPADLAPVPQTQHPHRDAEGLITDLRMVHQQTYDRLVASASKYKAYDNRERRHVMFLVGDLVWVILTKDRYTSHEYNKLVARKIGTIEVVAKINDNAYRPRLPPGYRTPDVFIVKHLVPYVCEVDVPFDSWTNHIHP
ncbi:uncharacterized protein [Henckelia pumila]|uniref:uncharacterized protein n=1 Tax=Henckelia pumila TaxID=405737 RepID=UPI003C6E4119